MLGLVDADKRVRGACGQDELLFMELQTAHRTDTMAWHLIMNPNQLKSFAIKIRNLDELGLWGAGCGERDVLVDCHGSHRGSLSHKSSQTG